MIFFSTTGVNSEAAELAIIISLSVGLLLLLILLIVVIDRNRKKNQRNQMRNEVLEQAQTLRPSELKQFSIYWEVNPLSPNIHIQILLTDLHTFILLTNNWLKDQSNFLLMIILLILITFSLAEVLILLGEI